MKVKELVNKIEMENGRFFICKNEDEMQEFSKDDLLSNFGEREVKHFWTGACHGFGRYDDYLYIEVEDK